MPRVDPTFSSADLLRFWAKNLEATEQRDVLVVFAVALAIAAGRARLFKLFGTFLSLACRFAPDTRLKILCKIVVRVYKSIVAVEEIDDFVRRAQDVLARADLTLGDINAVIDESEDA